MCGRYGESKILEQVRSKFPFFRADSALKPRYNIAPTQMAPVIVSQGEMVLKDMRWGLIPFWAKGEDIGSRMINARAETVKETSVKKVSDALWQTNPSLRKAGRTFRRCLRALKQNNDPVSQSMLLDALADYYAQTGDLDRAAKCWESSPPGEAFSSQAAIIYGRCPAPDSEAAASSRSHYPRHHPAPDG